MKRLVITTFLGLALVLGVGFVFFASLEEPAACQSCTNGGASDAKKIFEKFVDECEKLDKESVIIEELCFDEHKTKVYEKLLSKFKGLAKGGTFGPGNRILFADETRNSGPIVKTSDDELPLRASHTFLTGIPSPRYNGNIAIYFRLSKKGEAGAIVTICSVDKKGNQTQLGTIKWNETDDPQQEKYFTARNMAGKILQLEIKRTGGAVTPIQGSEKLKYSLSIKRDRNP